MHLSENKENITYAPKRIKHIKRVGLSIKIHKGLRDVQNLVPDYGDLLGDTHDDEIVRSAHRSLNLNFEKLALKPAHSASFDQTPRGRDATLFSDLRSNRNVAASILRPVISESSPLHFEPGIAIDSVRRVFTENCTFEDLFSLINLSGAVCDKDEADVINSFLRYLSSERIRETKGRFQLTDFMVRKEVAITTDMLTTVADWMIGLFETYPLSEYIVHLAWDLLYSFLEKFPRVDRESLQKSAKTAVRIAFKLGEMDVSFTEKEVEDLGKQLVVAPIDVVESEFLKTVKFDLLWPSDVVFLKQYIQVLDWKEPRLEKMCGYLLDVGMHDHELSLTTNSRKAAAVLWLGRCVLNNPSYRSWRALPANSKIFDLIDADACYEPLIASKLEELESLSDDKRKIIMKVKYVRQAEAQLKPLWPPLLEILTTYSEWELIPLALRYHRCALQLLAETVRYKEMLDGKAVRVHSAVDVLKFCKDLKCSESVLDRPVSSSGHTLRWNLFTRHRSRSNFDAPAEYLKGSLEYLIPNFPLIQCPTSCECLVCCNLLRFHLTS